MICPNCGYVGKDTDKFCIRCATRLVPEETVAAEFAEQHIEAAEQNIEAVGERAFDEVNAVAEDAAEAIDNAAAEVEAKAEAVFEQEPPIPYVNETVPIEPITAAVPVAPVAPVQPEVPVQPVQPVMPVSEPVAQPVECSRIIKPLSTWGFLWRLLLFMIPIFNIIPLFVMAFSSGINKNSRGLSRAVLILMLIGFVLTACGIIYLLAAYGTDTITAYLNRIWEAITSLGK